ncbi:MAG: steroid delta-isomerase-like uncharacterized protein [Arenicella sp.]|jgi:steroid delta-isomerase-like uncharacterized protein
MSTEINKKVVRDWIEEGWNKGNIDMAEEFYSPEYRAAPMAENEAPLVGIKAIKQLVLDVRRAFPDIHFKINSLVAEGDMVVGAFDIEGTHQGEFFNTPATGKKVNFTAIDIWRFDSGKIVERPVAVADFLGLLQQIGAVHRFS